MLGLDDLLNLVTSSLTKMLNSTEFRIQDKEQISKGEGVEYYLYSVFTPFFLKEVSSFEKCEKSNTCLNQLFSRLGYGSLIPNGEKKIYDLIIELCLPQGGKRKLAVIEFKGPGSYGYVLGGCNGSLDNSDALKSVYQKYFERSSSKKVIGADSIWGDFDKLLRLSSCIDGKQYDFLGVAIGIIIKTVDGNYLEAINEMCRQYRSLRGGIEVASQVIERCKKVGNDSIDLISIILSFQKK